MSDKLWQAIQELFVSLEESQSERLWEVARKKNPQFVLDDLLNPQDHPDLFRDPKFNYEDGQLTAIKSCRIAVNQLLKSYQEQEMSQVTDGRQLSVSSHRTFPQGWNIADVHAWQVREQILQTSKRRQFQSARPQAIVFDLDGTLFDVSGRTLGLFREWLKTSEARQFPKALLAQGMQIDFKHMGYSLRHAFENAGIPIHTNSIEGQFYTAAQRYWKEHFFDGKSLVKYDFPIPGAKDFVWQMRDDGFRIVYLTGRSHSVMAKGTMKALEKHGFPIDNVDVHLKKDVLMEDSIYKKTKFVEINELYDVIGNFENEYINIYSMAEYQSECVHVIVDSMHSEKYVDPLGIQIFRISSFL